MTLYQPTLINSRECIGNSLITINNAFSGLYQNDSEILDTLTTTSSTLQGLVTVPIGSIIMWSGPIVNSATTPSLINASSLVSGTSAYIQVNGQRDLKWAVCTGAGIGGVQTPNLIGRFILGAGARPINSTTRSNAFYDRNETGGVETVVLQNINIPKLIITPLEGTFAFVVPTESYTPFVTSVTLNDQSQLVGNLSVNQPGYNIAFDLSGPVSQTVVNNEAEIKTAFLSGASINQSQLAINNNNSSLTVQTSKVFSVSNEISATVPESKIGSDAPAATNNMPPYYAMYYIMRVR
jgi:hypothetical protein